MTVRPRGTLVYPMPPSVSGPFDHYALLVRPDNQVRMVHSEGVAYPVTNEKPWRWNDYSECEIFTPVQLVGIAVGENIQPVDLADWIRTFGARLESNFHQIRQWAMDGKIA